MRLLKLMRCGTGLCDRDNPGGIAIQPRAGSEHKRHAAPCKQRRKSVCQRIVIMTVRGMRRHIRRLADRDERVILIQHTQRHRHGNNVVRGCRIFIRQRQNIPCAQCIPHCDVFPVDGNAHRQLFQRRDLCPGQPENAVKIRFYGHAVLGIAHTVFHYPAPPVRL